MKQTKAEIGLIGLGVMGRNLAYNIAEHGFVVAGHDRSSDQVSQFIRHAESKNVLGTDSLAILLEQLKRPRAILLLVPAGEPVSSILDDLGGRLDAGDIVIDGGNSHFTDTNRHIHDLSKKGIQFLGMGISGGAEGARTGPSLMPGGSKPAFDRLEPLLRAIAAKTDDGDRCVAYLGPGAAGHYVKMVHNGIEYAVMQLISETYDLLRRLTNENNDEIAGIFDNWNNGPLSSYLVHITSAIMKEQDRATGQYLIDMILDSAGQKGTGKWTSQEALDLQVPIPTIDAAVSMRYLSAYKEKRMAAAKTFPPLFDINSTHRPALIKSIEAALQFSVIVAYAQGFSLLQTASDRYDYNLRLADIARIWRGGCIIRAEMLNDICRFYDTNPAQANLITGTPFADILTDKRKNIIKVLDLAFDHGLAAAGMASTLSYYYAYQTGRLPANLIQAQRDFFGSHGYRRIDSQGQFHTEWDAPEQETA